MGVITELGKWVDKVCEKLDRKLAKYKWQVDSNLLYWQGDEVYIIIKLRRNNLPWHTISKPALPEGLKPQGISKVLLKEQFDKLRKGAVSRGGE